MKYFVYYDREGKKQVDKIESGNPYKWAEPTTAYMTYGYMTPREIQALPDYKPEYDVSDIMDINGFMLKR